MIYFDNNATTQLDSTVLDAMLPYLTDFYLNPASVAGDLFGVNLPIQAAKAGLAKLLGGDSKEFYLTSGATESNNWALQATAQRSVLDKGTCRILVSAIEHPSILETARSLAFRDSNIQCGLIPVHANGQIDLEALRRFVAIDTTLVSIMLANNESGVIQPLAEAANIIKTIAPSCIVHTDATQAVGKIPIDLNGHLVNIDLLSLSAHKFHGPKGVGSLYIRDGTNIEPWLLGGGQQGGMRAGTESPAHASGIARASELAITSLEDVTSRIEDLRDSFERRIQSLHPTIQVIGSSSPRLPNTSLLVFPDHEGEWLVHYFLEKRIITSTGSACSSGSDQPSHVVLSMGISYRLARNALRLSISRYTRLEDIDCLIEAISMLLDSQE